MDLKFGDKIKIKTGFYGGCYGIVTHHYIDNTYIGMSKHRYTVDVIKMANITTKTFRCDVSKENLELISNE